jgi:hypothetical protein
MSRNGSNPTAEETAAKEVQERESSRRLKSVTSPAKLQAVHHPTLRAPMTLHPTPTPTPIQVMKMSKMVMIQQRRRQRREEMLRRRRRPRSSSRR